MAEQDDLENIKLYSFPLESVKTSVLGELILVMQEISWPQV